MQDGKGKKWTDAPGTRRMDMWVWTLSLILLSPFGAVTAGAAQEDRLFPHSQRQEGSDPVAIPRAEFRNCPPVTSVQTLSNGQKVEFPICYEDARSIAIEGSVDINLLDAELRTHRLLGVPFNKGRALVRWYFLEYDKTTLGPYREAFIGAVTSREEKCLGMLQLLRMWNGMPGTAPEDVGIFELNLWVDRSLPQQAGNELLGTRKELAEINSDLKNNPPEFSMVEKGEVSAFSLNGNMSPFFPEVFGNNLDFHLLTRGQKGARTRFKGKSSKASWKKVGKSLSNPSLERLDFQPKSVILAPGYDGALYEPSLEF